jgi:hypothetical protein
MFQRTLAGKGHASEGFTSASFSLTQVASRKQRHAILNLRLQRCEMATRKQVEVARKNIKKAPAAATRRQTIAHLPAATRRAQGQQAAAGRRRRGEAGHALEDRNRQQLYATAKERNIPGRSQMGKWDLIKAIRKAA